MSKADELMRQQTNGTMSLVDAYEQGKRVRAFSPNDPGVANGLCEGQCLHWLRGVVQGGADTYKPGQQNKDGTARAPKDLLDKAKQQHTGGVVASRMLLSVN